jgi:hypothetical protein
MPEENRFFRFVWRLDVVLLALAGLLAIVLLGALAVSNLFGPRFEPAPEGNFRPVPKGAEQNYTYRLEDQADVDSLPHEKMLALRRWKGAPETYGLAKEYERDIRSASSVFTDAVNLLAIDTSNGTSRWLFDGYARSILSQEIIYSGGPPPPQATSSAAVASVIRSIDADTNRDGEFDEKDIQSLYFYRPGDKRAIRFFTADYILSEKETDDGDFLVVYEKGSAAFAVTYHVPDFKLKSRLQLPDVPR